MNPFDVFTKLLKINPTAGKFLSIGLMLLAASAIIASFGVAEDTLYRTGGFIIGFSVLILILMNFNGLIIRVLSWALVISFLMWSGAVLAQILTGNAISWFATSQCLTSPWSNSCAIIANSKPDKPQVSISNLNSSNLQASVKRVVVHFAGSIERDQAIEFSKSLLAEKWPINNPKPGGIRTGNADGLNEVRYFHEADSAAAKALAAVASAQLPVDKKLGTRDLSKTQYSTAKTKGLLEIWFSN